MELRSEIDQILKASKMSIRQLSIKSGVRRQSIMHFLNGGNIHLNNLDKMLAALGRSLNITNKAAQKNEPIDLLRKRIRIVDGEIKKFCKANGIKYLAIFGSALRDDFGKESDIDIVIAPKKPITYFELSDIEEGLKELFRTDRKLDVITQKSVSPLLISEIDKSCEVLYEKAA